MIVKFRGAHGYLSNFYSANVEFEGLIYPTAEHAFQAAKTLHIASRERCRDLESPGEAKRFGRRLTLRSDWEEVKEAVMLDVLRSKFTFNPTLGRRLADTGSTTIIEGNNWNDKEWGAVFENDRWVGKNLLGKLLMRVRTELQTEAMC